MTISVMGVLDLETGIHLEEVELARAVDQELHVPALTYPQDCPRPTRPGPVHGVA